MSLRELEEQIKDKIKFVNERQIRHNHQKLGSLKLYKGQSCWEFNLFTQEVKKAAVEKNAILTHDERGKEAMVVEQRVLAKSGCVYVVAINKPNALRKFIKLIDRMTKL